MAKVIRIVNGIQRSVTIPDTQTIRLNGGNGHGSTNTKVRRFNSTTENSGASLVTYTDSSTEGASFTLQEDCQIYISYSEAFDAASAFGISLNSSQLTTDVDTITSSTRRIISATASADHFTAISYAGEFNSGDVIRPHTMGDGNSTLNNSLVHFELYVIKL